MFDWNHVFHCGNNGSGNVSTMICWKSEACSTHFQPLASLGGFGKSDSKTHRFTEKKLGTGVSGSIQQVANHANHKQMTMEDAEGCS